jgi:type II secretory pathway component GspD/PulD (secretin)
MHTFKRFAILLAVASLMSGVAVAQDAGTGAKPTTDVSTAQTGAVTIASRGRDVREVISDLFTQAKKNFVIERTPRTELFLALNNVEFEEALSIVARVSGLQYEIQNGIYYISRIDPTKAGEASRPKGRLAETVLTRKFTTRLAKTDFRDVLKAIAEQTKVTLEVDPSLSGRMVDAFLIDTTLKQGLEMLTQALGLDFRLTENQSIMIFRPNPNRVTLADGKGN